MTPREGLTAEQIRGLVSEIPLEKQLKRMRKIEKNIVKLSDFEAFTNTLKALIGIGFLSVPIYFKSVGIIGGILGTIFIVMLSNISNYFMFKSIEKYGVTRCRTMGNLAKITLGNKGKYAVELIAGCA